MPNTVERKKIALCGIILGVCMKKQKQARAQRRVWCKDWLRRRGELGSHATIYRELHDNPEDGFIQYISMDVNSFHTLLAKVEPYITKQDTHFRQSICAEARLEATLRFLASGCSFIHSAAVLHQDIQAEFVSHHTGNMPSNIHSSQR